MKTSTQEHVHFGRVKAQRGVRITRSEGAHVFDARGRKYLDFLSGSGVGNLGWSFEPTRAAIAKHAGPPYVSPSFAYAGWVELARLLDEITPASVTKAFRATGGSEAVDLALQAAMLHTGRRAFVSLEGAYHGNTLAALSVGGAKLRALPKCHTVPPHLDERTLARIEKRLAKRDVAAVILEPVVMNLGVRIPAPGFHQELMHLCKRTGTLLIADEVMSGFGRTGKLFACEHDDVQPDLLCVAKSLANGTAPIGATLMSASVARSMEKEGSYWSTYGWHPLSTSVAIATIRWLQKNEAKLMRHVASMSDVFRARLEAMPFVKELRTKGLAIAFALDDAVDPDALAQRCLDGGLILDADDDGVLLVPPLSIEEDDVHRAMDILEDAAARA